MHVREPQCVPAVSAEDVGLGATGSKYLEMGGPDSNPGCVVDLVHRLPRVAVGKIYAAIHWFRDNDCRKNKVPYKSTGYKEN